MLLAVEEGAVVARRIAEEVALGFEVRVEGVTVDLVVNDEPDLDLRLLEQREDLDVDVVEFGEEGGHLELHLRLHTVVSELGI